LNNPLALEVLDNAITWELLVEMKIVQYKGPWWFGYVCVAVGLLWFGGWFFCLFGFFFVCFLLGILIS